VEIFEDLTLKANFTDPTILHTAFYEGLKWDVRHDMVDKTPDMLAELKALAIQLDKEHLGVDHCEPQIANNCTTATDSNKVTCHSTLQVKAKVACIRTSLSADNQAQYLWEGCCFSCGKPSHCHPKCPDGRP
jgi:hypothetical protein